MVDGAIPGLLIPGSIRTWTEQVMGSRSVSSIFSWPLHQLLLSIGHCPV